MRAGHLLPGVAVSKVLRLPAGLLTKPTCWSARCLNGHLKMKICNYFMKIKAYFLAVYKGPVGSLTWYPVPL